MLRLSLLILLAIINQSEVFSQCIDRNKIKYGGDYDFVNYIFHCPTFSFAVNGDTSHAWNVLGDPIDIKQASPKALYYKKVVEAAVKEYAGIDFYSSFKFIDVEVVYPEKYAAFSGRSDVSQKFCKAKYFYHYQFRADTASVYLIGIAVNDNGVIISPFNFPSKKYFKPIDKTFTYCKLIDIARNVEKNIDPIDEIKLEYDKRTKRFYWLITQAITNSHEGINYINQVEIDAADLSKANKVKSQVSIIY